MTHKQREFLDPNDEAQNQHMHEGCSQGYALVGNIICETQGRPFHGRIHGTEPRNLLQPSGELDRMGVMSLLPRPLLLEVHAASVSAGLHRDSLLRGISPSFVASLSNAPNPTSQLLGDITELNRVGQLVDGTVPLQIWLENAEALSGLRDEAGTFRRAIQSLASSSIGNKPPVAPQMHNGATTILFLAACPSDTTALELDREIRLIRNRLYSSTLGHAFRFEQEWAVSADDLQTHLLRHRPTIVHFSGHGSAKSEIILEDASRKSKPVAAAAVAELFRILRGSIRCVVLNSCFSQEQAHAISAHIDCVIGTTRAIRDDSAIAFAGALYRALGFGTDLKTAFDLACNQIDLTGYARADIPQLIPRDGIVPGEIRLAAGHRA